MQTMTLPLIRSTRIDKKWKSRGSEVTLPVSQMRMFSQGKCPKVDPKAFAEAVKKMSAKAESSSKAKTE